MFTIVISPLPERGPSRSWAGRGSVREGKEVEAMVKRLLSLMFAVGRAVVVVVEREPGDHRLLLLLYLLLCGVGRELV